MAFAGALHEVVGLGFDPGNKCGNVRVTQECIDRVVLPCQFGLVKQGMNLTMAYPVQIFGLPASFGFGNQMVRISLAEGNLALTKRTHQFHGRYRNPFLLK